MDPKDTYTSVFLNSADITVTAAEIKKYRPVWWWNVRSKESGGLRLTEAGLDFIVNKSNIKTYNISLPADFAITPQVLIWLDQFIDSPFYINKKTITVLKEKAAFELYLFSGDIKKFGYNKALSKRLSQNLPA
jgi:hypothetical protein